MTARAALDSYIETLQILAREGDTDRTNEEQEQDTAHRTKLINDFAHELAEQQRTYAREVGVPLEDGNTVCAGDAIDDIDPHVGGLVTAPDLADDGLCRATLQGWPIEIVDECARKAGHYREEDHAAWHQSVPDPEGNRRTWSDSASGATPHHASPARPDEEPS